MIRLRKYLAIPFFAVLLLAAAACGSDDPSPEEAYCDSGDELSESFNALLDLDVIAEGTNGVSDAIDQVESDLSDFRAAAEDVTSEEVSGLEAAFGDVQDAFSALGDDGITVENGAAVIDALAALAPAGEAVFTTLVETC